MFPVIKHASSHGLSVLVCTVASALIIEIFRPKLPHFMESMTNISTKVLKAIHLPMSVENMNILLLATLLAVIWGVFFKLSLSRSRY